MTAEIATVQVLPLRTARQPLKHQFPGRQKESQIFMKRHLLSETGPSPLPPLRNIVIYSVPFQNAVDYYTQKEKSFMPDTHVPREAQKKFLSCYHRCIFFASASNNWWDHSPDCHEVKILAINILNLLDQKRQPISWHSPELPDDSFHSYISISSA